MREIKFRFWNGKSMYTAEPLTSAVELWVEPDVQEIMQYTGLKDSYNTEEYFGDVIESEDGTRRVIEDGCSAVLFKDIRTGAASYFWQLSRPHRVIGNIQENPELLDA